MIMVKLFCFLLLGAARCERGCYLRHENEEFDTFYEHLERVDFANSTWGWCNDGYAAGPFGCIIEKHHLRPGISLILIDQNFPRMITCDLTKTKQQWHVCLGDDQEPYSIGEVFQADAATMIPDGYPNTIGQTFYTAVTLNITCTYDHEKEAIEWVPRACTLRKSVSWIPRSIHDPIKGYRARHLSGTPIGVVDMEICDGVEVTISDSTGVFTCSLDSWFILELIPKSQFHGIWCQNSL